MSNTLLISGIHGRMGEALMTQAEGFGFSVIAGIGKTNGAIQHIPVYSAFSLVPDCPDIIIDFSSPSLLASLLDYAVSKQRPCVLGTTGFNEEDLFLINRVAERIPVFYSPNLSLGLYVLKHIAREAARMLPQYDIEIVERHHNTKADHPSGTALALFDAVKSAHHQAVFGRRGITGPRKNEEIGIHAIRGGTIAGEHQVGYYGHQEILTLTHCAQDKEVFAVGALRAARFLLDKKPGLYGMDDMMKSFA